MSKKFNVKDIVDERKNELDHSPLFQSKKPISELKDEPIIVPPIKENLDSQPAIKSPSASSMPQQPAQPSSKKSFVRRTFDFYEEQITYLTRESLRERLAGKEGSMNAMVRESMDDWIKKRTSKK